MEDIDEEALADNHAQFRKELMNATDERIISVYLKKIVDEGENYSNHMYVDEDVFSEDPRHACLVMSPSFSNQSRTEACGRTDGCESGCWRIIGRDKLIKYKDTGKFLGFKRIFKFCRKTIPREYKRSWVMEEYRLLSKRNSKQDHVICKIQFLFQSEISFLLAKHFSYSSDTRPTQSLPVYGDLSGQGGAYYLDRIIGSGENKWPRDVTNDVYCLHPLTLVDPQDWDFLLTGLCIFANRTTASGFTDECDSGCWRIMDPDIPIISRRMKIPGFKRVFRFHEKEEKYNFYYTKCGADVKATWIMEEYRLADEGMKDKVLCVIILQR